MATTRICFVGGGSYQWTPKLLTDIALTKDLSGTIVLHDIAPEPMDVMQQLGRKIMQAAGADFAIETSGNLEEALKDAEFVIVTITTGGLEAMRKDLDIPLRYGIYQSVGDTVGPGGWSRALRNVPVMVGIAKAMEKSCPNAWMLNLTNPLTALTRAVYKTTSVKAMGLCHELQGVRGGMIRMFGNEVEDYEMKVAGINHLIWLLDLKINGRDGFEMVREYEVAGKSVPLRSTSGGHRAPFQDRWRVKQSLLETYGYLPAAGDRHVAEFFPYFLNEETGAGEDYGVLLTKIEHRYDMLHASQAEVKATLASDEPMTLAHSPEESADIIAAMVNGRPFRAIVNVPNTGQIDNLPRDVIVETLAEVGATGVNPIGVGALPAGVLGTLHPHVVNQELLVDAALTGDRQLALQALLGDPLVKDYRAAPKLMDELLEAHAELLPQF
jgi:alpha-galactosidase/6-phospho-beta-glucosidase family protein